MNSNYTGLTQSYWIGTWSAPNGAYPVILDTEIRGGLRTITADVGERLTDINGLFLQDGMLVYLRKSYTSNGGVPYTGGMYYKYTNSSDRSTTSPRGVLANGDSYWSPFVVTGSSSQVDTSTFYPRSNPSGFVTSSDLSNYLTTSSASATYYPQTNPNGFITNSDLSSYLTSSSASNTYYPKTNPSGFITGIDLSSYLTSSSASLVNITGGDLTGRLLSATVKKLQGYSLDLTAPPADGQTLQWDAGSSSWRAGAIPVGGNGGGGRVYYFDFGNKTGIAPSGGLPTTGDNPLSLLGKAYEVGSGQAISAELDPRYSEHLICSFVTASGDPGAINIPAGLWDINIWASVNSASTTQCSIRAQINIYNPTTSGYRYLASTDDVYLYEADTIAQYILNATVPQTGIASNERIYIQIFGKKYTTNNRNITIYFDSYRPSHIHTTLPSVAGDGIVKVVNGILQTPATNIFDSDVDANANIAQTKIQGLTASLNSLYPKNNPSGFITGVNLSSYLTTSSASNTYYPKTNPSGFITGIDLSSYLTTNSASSTYYPKTNPSGFITGVNLSSYITNSQTGNFYTNNNPSGYVSDAPSNGTGYIRKNNSWMPNNEPLSPFPSRSNININYNAGNISSIIYTYTGVRQGYADYSYDGSNNLQSITYKASDHTTVLRTLIFGYNGSDITGYIVT